MQNHGFDADSMRKATGEGETRFFCNVLGLREQTINTVTGKL